MALKNAGGLWLKQGKKGKFFSGEFQPEGRGGPVFKILVFKNEDKQGKQPDYRICLSDGEDDRQAKQEEDEAPF